MLKLVQHRLLRQGLDKGLIEHLVQTNLRTLSPAVLNDETRLTRYMQKQLEATLRPQKNSIAILQNRILCLTGAHRQRQDQHLRQTGRLLPLHAREESGLDLRRYHPRGCHL